MGERVREWAETHIHCSGHVYVGSSMLHSISSMVTDDGKVHGYTHAHTSTRVAQQSSLEYGNVGAILQIAFQ